MSKAIMCTARGCNSQCKPATLDTLTRLLALDCVLAESFTKQQTGLDHEE